MFKHLDRTEKLMLSYFGVILICVGAMFAMLVAGSPQ
jgi:hypothetical protein